MANVSIKVNDQDKKEVEKIFSELGLTISSATNAFFKQVILHNGIPFKLRTKRKSSTISHIPNNETIKAIKECEQGGNSTTYSNYAEFLKELESEQC